MISTLAGFDVAVDQSGGVGGVQCAGDLGDDVDYPARGQRSAVQDGREVGSFDQAHVDVELSVDLAEVVDGDDVGFVQSRGERGLGAESGLEHGVGCQRGGQSLEGDEAIMAGVKGPVDLSHAAATDQFLKPIASEHRSQRCVHVVAR